MKKKATVIGNRRFAEGTLRVCIERQYAHPIYRKIISSRKCMNVQYDCKQPVALHTQVYIKPCAPVSKTKRWKVEEIIC